MKEYFVSFEIAKKLKEKGFKTENTDWCYLDGDLVQVKKYINISPYEYAPTISQVLKWLREKDIMVEIPVDLGDNGVWQFTFRIQTKEFYDRATKDDYTSYESAALAGIEHVIDNLI